MTAIPARAAILRTPGQPLDIVDIVVADPRPDEIRVRMVATGICHTDLIMIAGHMPAPLPAVLGHEGAGVIEAIGTAVETLAVGDHVVMSFAHCGTCPSCLDGAPAYCMDFMPRNFGCCRADGSSAIDGPGTIHSHFFGQSSFATVAVCRANNAVKVDKDLPLELLGPLGCGVQTGAGAVMNSLKVRPGASIAVFGTGTVGLSAIMAAHGLGAATIIAIDTSADRLILARELGATATVQAGDGDTDAAIRAIAPRGLDFTLDTTGAPPVIATAMAVLAGRGTCGLVAGYPGHDPALPVGHLLSGGRTVRGIVEGDSVPAIFIPTLIALYRSGRFPFDRLIRFFDFIDIAKAIDAMATGRVVKPVIRFTS